MNQSKIDAACAMMDSAIAVADQARADAQMCKLDMDTGKQNRRYPGYTTAELKKMVAEIEAGKSSRTRQNADDLRQEIRNREASKDSLRGDADARSILAKAKESGWTADLKKQYEAVQREVKTGPKAGTGFAIPKPWDKK